MLYGSTPDGRHYKVYLASFPLGNLIETRTEDAKCTLLNCLFFKGQNSSFSGLFVAAEQCILRT